MSNYKQSDTVLAEAFEDTMVLYNTDTERYFSLNSLGAEIWNLLSQPSSLETLVEHVISEYEVEAEVAKSDVEELLASLRQGSLIQSTGS